jgi:hypothetical protein
LLFQFGNAGYGGGGCGGYVVEYQRLLWGMVEPFSGTADQQAMQTVLWSVGISAATGDRRRAGGGNA